MGVTTIDRHPLGGPSFPEASVEQLRLVEGMHSKRLALSRNPPIACNAWGTAWIRAICESLEVVSQPVRERCGGLPWG